MAAADSRRFALVNAVLTFLVAFALLFAPAAQAMQCHERPAHGHSGFEHSSVVTKDAHASLLGGLHTPDHKGCCTVQCGFCIVLTGMVRTQAPATTASSLRFAWGDQIGSGLALPPTLGPPRLPV
ncbi:hypothetical protein AM571_CH01662 [Rhizobium etli 8C-3]|uniref:DUF2946 family protein n=2 Tax=Rhizobium TaxID=379 RepID=A0A4R3QX86_9HYPH|nr:MULTISPECIES: hypothetical protein [Rhizobium]APO74486.1 hypothetical protein AM571_CH01662 [Rhizobium etli 8C-3]TCU23226.1 hypothetical protein EV130_108375 [Rhizobium azibense]TCU36805.1 hypothetical protein EV129_107377 [Rhizobium azibense]